MTNKQLEEIIKEKTNFDSMQMEFVKNCIKQGIRADRADRSKYIKNKILSLESQLDEHEILHQIRIETKLEAYKEIENLTPTED